MSRKIIHIDMDCFFAAVEMRDDPSLRGQPLAIGGQPGKRGVLATCNYEARAFGLHSAMPSSQAIKRCPQLTILPPRMDKYRQVSRQIQQIFRQYTDLIEPLSLDEAYLDVSDCLAFEGSATRIAEVIRQQIFEQLGLTASAGIAPNKLLAKIASDWRKPNGQFVIRPQQVAAFMPDLPVKKIHGVGKVTAQKLHAMGIQTCGDLQQLPASQLEQWFGKFGQRLYEQCRGIDERPVRVERQRQSLSIERTFEQDRQLSQLTEILDELYPRFVQRLQQHKAKYPDVIQGLVVKIKYRDFQQITRQTSRQEQTQQAFYDLLYNAWKEDPRPVRLLGIGVRLGRAGIKQSQTDQLILDL